mmetsp:Transcript_2914/g.6818  ORF Transcript_2914/g.6818 Transcript_2914/m.6818 type:complete len:331 (+) Transcript_2914:103-1095(+)
MPYMFTSQRLPNILPSRRSGHALPADGKQRVKAACTNCKKAKARCDHGRPCSRCVERGLTECVSAFPRRVGRRRNHFFDHIVTEEEVIKSGEAVTSKTKRRKRTRRAKPSSRTKRLRTEKKTPEIVPSGKRRQSPSPLNLSFGKKAATLFELPTFQPKSEEHVLGSPKSPKQNRAAPLEVPALPPVSPLKEIINLSRKPFFSFDDEQWKRMEIAPVDNNANEMSVDKSFSLGHGGGEGQSLQNPPLDILPTLPDFDLDSFVNDSTPNSIGENHSDTASDTSLDIPSSSEHIGDLDLFSTVENSNDWKESYQQSEKSDPLGFEFPTIFLET